MKNRIVTFVGGILLFSGCLGFTPVSGGELRTTSKLKFGERQPVEEASRVEIDNQIKEPDGKPPKDASVDLLEWLGYERQESSESTEDASALKPPLHYFDPEDDGSSIINSAILSFISMAVYSERADQTAFDYELEDLLIPLGAIDVEAFVDNKGTEGAVVTLPGATIIAFRGTSGEGTDLPIADQLADINDYPYLVEIDGDDMYLHEGFWHNAVNNYSWIYWRAYNATQNDRKVWVTGHSLGGALATHTALLLHYDQNISVQGLQTFGSPRTGDLTMFTKFFEQNDHGDDLWSATTRWVVDGDPATTFFYGNYLGAPFISTYVKYEHVGKTNTIYGNTNDGFTVEPNTGEDHDMKWVISGLNQGREHMWYHPALVEEAYLQLSEEGYFEVADLLWEALKL